MHKTELPFTVKDGMLTGPNGSWRISDLSAVFLETKNNLVWNSIFYWMWILFGCYVAGLIVNSGVAGFLLGLVSIFAPAIMWFRSIQTSSEMLKVMSVVNGVKLEIWQKTYGSRSESEVKAQGEALVSLIRGAIEQTPTAKEKAAP